MPPFFKDCDTGYDHNRQLEQKDSERVHAYGLDGSRILLPRDEGGPERAPESEQESCRGTGRGTGHERGRESGGGAGRERGREPGREP